MKTLDLSLTRFAPSRLRPTVKPDTLVFALSLVFFLASLFLAPVP
jgi:hypothetical protein